VSRAVVLPELPPRRPHETTYGKVESRRAVLTLVVAGGGEWPRASRWGAVLEDVARGAVDERGPAPAPFVRRASPVPRARQDEAGMQVVEVGCVCREPGQCPDRSRREEDAIAEAMVGRCEPSAELGGHDQARQIVVAHPRVAAVGGDEHLGRLGARQTKL